LSYLDRINAYQEEMLATLQELIAIPSVETEPGHAGEPFGPDLARALEYVLAWGEKNGFAAKNHAGYAGHLEYGTGEETVGVLVHLDVVPAGEGWKYPPFSGQRAEERIYGRGAIDDKGPAVAAMYALKALKEEGIKLGKKIRLIFGCDEESGWQCMDYYFKHEPKPEYGFTPDAVFPLINCEKGQLGLVIEGEWQELQSGCRIESLSGGTRRNVVPEWAEAVLTFPDQQSLQAFKASIPETKVNEVQLSTGQAEHQLRIRVKGVSAHASLPQDGDNAITKLVEIISGIKGTGGFWPAVRFIQECFGRETDGRGLEINCHDQISGDLTINLGVLKTEQRKVMMEVDIRYPLCTSGEELEEKIEAKLAAYHLKINACSALPPHYLDANNWLIRTLLRVYQEETGEQATPLAIGGRTYAVTLGNAVAFGPVFPGRPELAHQKDEYISVQDLMACTRIFARALYELAKAGAERG